MSKTLLKNRIVKNWKTLHRKEKSTSPTPTYPQLLTLGNLNLTPSLETEALWESPSQVLSPHRRYAPSKLSQPFILDLQSFHDLYACQEAKELLTVQKKKKKK